MGRLISGVFIALLVCKLAGLIDWSWWWVSSPLWLSFLLYTLAVVAAIIYYSDKNR